MLGLSGSIFFFFWEGEGGVGVGEKSSWGLFGLVQMDAYAAFHIRRLASLLASLEPQRRLVSEPWTVAFCSAGVNVFLLS